MENAVRRAIQRLRKTLRADRAGVEENKQCRIDLCGKQINCQPQFDTDEREIKNQ